MLRAELTRRVAAVLAFAAAVGCGGLPEAPRSQARTEEPGEPDAGASPGWAAYYGGAFGGVELTAREQALWNRIAAVAGARCQVDPRLTAAAREHAFALARSRRLGGEGELDRLRFTLLRLGGTDYALEPFVTRLDPAGEAALAALVEKRAGDWSHCGVGVAGSGESATAVWIGVDRPVVLDPFPVSPEPSAVVGIRGTLRVRSDRPIDPFVGNPDGTVVKLASAPVLPDGRFQVRVPISRAGRYEVELLVDRSRGMETAVLLPLFAGVAPDKRPVVLPDPGDDGGRQPPETALFDLLAEARRRAGAPPLARDPALDRVASEHSREMAERRFFGHVSPYRGALDARLARNGLAPSRSAENVARSSSLLRIHRNLMESPSHRINALDPAFNRVGIGVARDAGSLIATEIFARF